MIEKNSDLSLMKQTFEQFGQKYITQVDSYGRKLVLVNAESDPTAIIFFDRSGSLRTTEPVTDQNLSLNLKDYISNYYSQKKKAKG